MGFSWWVQHILTPGLALDLFYPHPNQRQDICAHFCCTLSFTGWDVQHNANVYIWVSAAAFCYSQRNVDVLVSSLLQERHVCVLNLQSSSTVPSHSPASTGRRSTPTIAKIILKSLWPEKEQPGICLHSFTFVSLIPILSPSKSTDKPSSFLLAFLCSVPPLLLYTPGFVTTSVAF